MRERTLQLTIVITGSAIAVALGIIFYVKPDVPTALATMALILGGIMTLQVEATFRRIRDEQAQTEQGQLMAQLEANSWLRRFTKDVAVRAAEIKQKYDLPFVNDMLMVQLRNQFKSALDDVQAGHILVPHNSDHKLVFWIMENCRVSVLATDVYKASHLHIGDPSGDKYRQLNEQALGREVLIERVVIYSNWTDEIDRNIREQRKLGIHTFRVKETSLKTELRVDLAIWDERYASELSFNANGDITDSYISFSPPEIARIRNRYEEIKSFAEPWPPIPAPRVRTAKKVRSSAKQNDLGEDLP